MAVLLGMLAGALLVLAPPWPRSGSRSCAPPGRAGAQRDTPPHHPAQEAPWTRTSPRRNLTDHPELPPDQEPRVGHARPDAGGWRTTTCLPGHRLAPRPSTPE